MILGGWNFDEVKGVNLPQKAQSAFTEVTSGLMGANYEPVLYAGSQVVNGVNYCIFALQTSLTAHPEQRLMKMIINVDGKGKANLVSVSVV